MRLLRFAVVAAAGGGCFYWFQHPERSRPVFDDSLCPPLKFAQSPTRRDCIAKLKQAGSAEHALDVLVIGGGATGTGVALDAATRGMSVGLVEANDYASGTSSRSTKLIHGGVRYLEKAIKRLDREQYNLVAEALRERAVMLHQAPHLCRPLQTMIPCYEGIDVPVFWIGMKIYDIIAAWNMGTIDFSYFELPVNCLTRFPRLQHEDSARCLLMAGIVYYDGQMDDARMCVSIALTAASYGAATANHCEVVEVKNTGELSLVTIRDKIAKCDFSVYTRSIVNAGGPFSDLVRKTAEDSRPSCMMPSSGTHITVPAQYCSKDFGLIAPSPDGRVVFTIPWLGSCIIGTTDHPTSITTEPRGTKDDVTFLLDSTQEYIGKIPLSDVKSVWCGIRPLAQKLPVAGSPPRDEEASNKPRSTQEVVREHSVDVNPENRMVSITGGKWTTYRKMSQDVVDALIKSSLLAQSPNASSIKKACVTEHVRLIGAHDLNRVQNDPSLLPASIPEEVKQRWLSAFGDKAPVVAKVSLELLRRRKLAVTPFAQAQALTDGEVRYCALFEHCETISDYLQRRSRLAFLDAKQAQDSINRVADVMAETLGWSFREKSRHIELATSSLLQFTPK